MTDAMERRLKRMDVDSSHQISSGTVIVCLATAVKELVENSLDAGATMVDIRLTESGTEVIEVSDNGHGITEEDFETLALRSHTSKITEFDDLRTVESFGFRGEAVSALAALSELTVRTRTADASVGHELVFDSKGCVVKKTKAQCKQGTTVYVRNLFANLPVRRDQLIQNAKTELAKLLRVLYGYGIIAGSRITCSNVSNGRTAVLMKTSGHMQMIDNINEIFPGGAKNKLVPVISCRPTEEILQEYNLREDDATYTYHLEGWISDCKHGSGRSANDRQFLFFNKRPCEYPKITKLISQVYREFNVKDHPFYALNICLEREKIDVNVVPNKNQILVQNEKLLLATLKASIRNTFGTTPSNVPLNQLSQMAPPPPKPVLKQMRLPGLPAINAVAASSQPDPARTTSNKNFFSQLKFGVKPKTASPVKRASTGERSPFKPKQNRPSGKLNLSRHSGSSSQTSKITDFLEPPVVISFDPPYDEVQTSRLAGRADRHSASRQLVTSNGIGPGIEEVASICGTPVNRTRPVVFSQFSTQNTQDLTPVPLVLNETSFGDFNPMGFSTPFYRQPCALPAFQSVCEAARELLESSSTALQHLSVPENLSPDPAEPRPAPFIGFDDTPFEEVPREGMGSPQSVIVAAPVNGTQDLTQENLDFGLDFEEDFPSLIPPTPRSTVAGAPRLTDDKQLMDDLGALEEQVIQELSVCQPAAGDTRYEVLGRSNNQSSTETIRTVSAFKPPLMSPSASPQRKKPSVVDMPSPNTANPPTPQLPPEASSSPGGSWWCAKPIGVIPGKRSTLTIPSSLERIRVSRTRAVQNRVVPKPNADSPFHAGLTPSQNDSAETELQRNIQKSDFLQMKIIGQFNDGFILTRLDDDVFIIDQHASDERFNYETLQNTVKVQSQKMIRPQPLSLTAVEETVLLDNQAVFLQNGFQLLVNIDSETNRVCLTSVPMYQDITLGQSDVMEMIHMLGETQGVNIRPSRVLQILASKACRKSVMIGKPLNVSEMSTIIQHMAVLGEPWDWAATRAEVYSFVLSLIKNMFVFTFEKRTPFHVMRSMDRLVISSPRSALMDVLLCGISVP